MRATSPRPGGRWAWAACLTLLAMAADNASSAGPTLRYAKPIDLPALDADELIAATLDSDVFAATRDGFSDIRILDADGRETAFIIRPMTETRRSSVRRTWPARRPEIKLLEDGALEIRVRLDEGDPAPAGIRLATPLANFEQRVEAFASHDGESWTPVLEDGLIFDYSQYIDVRSNSLAFSAAPRGRHYRIVINDVTKEQQSQLMELTRRLQGDDETDRQERVTIRRRPFRIDRLEYWADVPQDRFAGERRVRYPVQAATAAEDQQRQQTVIRVTTRRQPLTALRLETPDRNFSRAVRIEARQSSGGDAPWQAIASTTISRLDFRDLKREDLEATIPETRAEELRLVIENRDSSPLTAIDVAAFGTAYEAVFLARPGGAYRLAYGSPAMNAPRYDTATIEASLAANYQPRTAALGEPMELSPEAPTPSEPLLKRLINSPPMLALAAAALVIALGLGLYRASKRVDDLPR